MNADKKPIDGNNSATTTDLTAVIAAQGAGIRVCLTAAIFCNSSATPVLVAIKSGTTARGYVYVPAGQTAGFNLPCDGLLGAANSAWNFACSAGVSTVYSTFVGHIER